MSEKTEDKPKTYVVKVADTITLADTASVEAISTISGSIKQGIDALRGTFNTDQREMANSLNLDQNLEYLKKIAEELEKSRKLVEQQRDEAIKDAKRERRNFYVSLLVTIVLGVVAVIVGILAL